MKYSIKVVSKSGQENITEINGSSKVAVKSADQIQILLEDSSGILSFFGSKSSNTENLIAVKNGKNLEIILENGDVLTFTNFYNYAAATSILFFDGDGNVHTLRSTDTTMSDLGDGTFLVYAQGAPSTLLSMSSDDSTLNSILSNKFDLDSSSEGSSMGMGFAYAGLGLVAAAAAVSSSSTTKVAAVVATTASVSGTHAEVLTKITGTGSNTNATVSDAISITQANSLDTSITGVITATVSPSSLSALASITNANSNNVPMPKTIV